MQNKYYYLVASLPYLKFGEKPGITSGEFLEECSKWLSPADLALIKKIDISKPLTDGGDTELLSRLKSFDMRARRVLADIRRDIHPTERGLHERAKEVLGDKNPLDKERAIEKVRWDFSEGEEFKYTFDVNSLILYYIKIQILERLAGFEKEKGQKVFEELCGVQNEKADW